MNTILASTTHYVRLALGKGNLVDEGQRRYVRIVHGIFTGLLGRGVAIIVSLISVPLTTRYLGAERYGAWITISTLMTWIAFVDLGTSNSLTNAISEAYAHDRRDMAQTYVASAFWMQIAFIGLIATFFLWLWHSMSWDRLLNVQSLQARAEVGPAVAVAFAIFALNFPLTSISKIYGGYQEVAKANGWNAAGNVLSLVALVLVTRFRGGLVLLVVGVSGAVLLVNVISAIWMFGWSKPWLLPRLRSVSRLALKKISGLGSMFFLLQLGSLALFQTDNLIIAYFLGASAVTPYSVAWRLFTYTTIFQILALPSYWPAYAEAFTRGDRAWIRRSFRLNFAIGLSTTVALAMPLVIFGQWIIGHWAGSVAVPQGALLFWMAVWSTIYAVSVAQACVLIGASRLKGQITYTLVAASVNLALSVLLVRKVGTVGVILSTIIAYLVCIIGPQTLEVRRALSEPDTNHSIPGASSPKVTA